MELTVRDRVIELAKKFAVEFLLEFDEPLNPGKTDWGMKAWAQICRMELKLAPDESVLYWPIFQLRSITETTPKRQW